MGAGLDGAVCGEQILRECEPIQPAAFAYRCDAISLPLYPEKCQWVHRATSPGGVIIGQPVVSTRLAPLVKCEQSAKTEACALPSKITHC